MLQILKQVNVEHVLNLAFEINQSDCTSLKDLKVNFFFSIHLKMCRIVDQHYIMIPNIHADLTNPWQTNACLYIFDYFFPIHNQH